MAGTTITWDIGTSGNQYSTIQLWEDGAPANLVTAENSPANTFTGTFIIGENLTFSLSGATGKCLDTDQTTEIAYGLDAGGDPVINDVVTGASSLATCTLTSSTPTNSSVIWQGLCEDELFSAADTVVTFSGSTNNTTSYKKLSSLGNSAFGDPIVYNPAQPLRYDDTIRVRLKNTGTNNGTVSIGETNVRLSNLQISNTHTGGGVQCSQTLVVMDNLIVEGKYTGTSLSAGIVNCSGTVATVSNCVFIQRASGADHIAATSSGSGSFYNCAFVAPDNLATAPTSIFVAGPAGAPTVQNCGLFAGDSTKAIVTTTGATYTFTTSYSDISGTAGVTQTTYSTEYVNVLDGTHDYRLRYEGNQRDNGTTDSTHASLDIYDIPRPQGAAYDVGPWETTTRPAVFAVIPSNSVGLKWL